MTDGPGQQPPQEPRTNAPDGEREVLEGRVIPSRQQPRHAADPRRDFRQQAPEAGPAWSPQADAASQAAPPPPAQSWSPAPDQPALDAPAQPPALHGGPPQTPAQPPAQAEPATQIIPAQSWPQPQQGAAPAQQPPQQPAQPYGGQPQGYAAQPPQQAQGGLAQGLGGQPQQQAQGGPQPQAYGGQPQQQPQPGPQGYAAPPQQPQAPAPQNPGGQPAGHVPFAGGPAPRPAPQAQQSGSGGGFRQEGRGTGDAGTPDWGALAERQEATGARRRVLVLTGGILAVVLIAGGVATAVVLSGRSSDKPTTNASSSGTASQKPLPPVPTFSSVAPPPPVNPLEYLNTAAKDKAPLTPASLFPDKQFVKLGRTYVKTRSDVTTSCAKNAQKDVAAALTANGCQKLVRATYTQGGLAVTVGVAVFADSAHAAKMHGIAQYLLPLNGGGVTAFCHAVRCQMTSNTVGRYAYFAIAGYKNGTTLAANDTVGKQAADEASDYAFVRIVQRGKDAAAADPTRQ